MNNGNQPELSKPMTSRLNWHAVTTASTPIGERRRSATGIEAPTASSVDHHVGSGDPIVRSKRPHMPPTAIAVTATANSESVASGWRRAHITGRSCCTISR